MTTTTAPAHPQSPSTETSAPRRTGGRRIARALGIGLAIVLAMTLVSTIANATITASEKAELEPYGEIVTTSAGDINVFRNGGVGPTMVLLSGYGTPAPAVDFAPLIRELDAFDVIVVEGFGYGYSELDVANRSIENITAELHEVLAKLEVDEPVILVGHSIGGLYARQYAQTYPDEVAAYIGIDPMAATTSSLDVDTPSTTDAILNTLGLVRVVTTIAPDLVQPPGNAYTPEERRRMAALANWNYGNTSISDEWSRIGANSTTAAAQPFAADLPVLEMLSTESVENIPDWLSKHEAELDGVTSHQLEVLAGPHYLHWTQAPEIGRLITQFVGAHATP